MQRADIDEVHSSQAELGCWQCLLWHACCYKLLGFSTGSTMPASVCPSYMPTSAGRGSTILCLSTWWIPLRGPGATGAAACRSGPTRMLSRTPSLLSWSSQHWILSGAALGCLGLRLQPQRPQPGPAAAVPTHGNLCGSGMHCTTQAWQPCVGCFNMPLHALFWPAGMTTC